MEGDRRGGDVEIEIWIAAPPAAVFPFLTDFWPGIASIL